MSATTLHGFLELNKSILQESQSDTDERIEFSTIITPACGVWHGEVLRKPNASSNLHGEPFSEPNFNYASRSEYHRSLHNRRNRRKSPGSHLDASVDWQEDMSVELVE